MSAKPLFIVLIGPGGVGKGTIARELTARDPHLWLSRSWTTREKRPSEDGSEYFFVTRDAFEKGIAEGKFLEWAEFNGNLYGTPVPEVLNEKDRNSRSPASCWGFPRGGDNPDSTARCRNADRATAESG